VARRMRYRDGDGDEDREEGDAEGSGTDQRVDDERLARDVVVLARGDHVPLLARRAVARADLDRGEVIAEVARAAHDEQALAARGLCRRQFVSGRRARCYCYGRALIEVFESARVAVLSRCCASAVAAGSSATRRGFRGAACVRPDKKRRAETVENIIASKGDRSKVRERGVDSRFKSRPCQRATNKQFLF
jgi:hypothetical protein